MKYHITNPTTGEIEEFETTVDIDLLQEYNGWVIEHKLNPPTYSPQEYARYLQTKNALEANEKAIAYADRNLRLGVQMDSEMIQTLIRILKDEE